MATRAILFDLDRTLVDVQSFSDYPGALARVEERIRTWQEPPTPPSGWDGPTQRAMGVLLALWGDPRWAEISAIIDEAEAAGVARSVAMPGLAAALRLSDGMPRAVVTLLTASVAREVLGRHGIGIELVIGRRPDLAAKPAGDMLLAAAAQLGVTPAQATMIGDSPWDQAGAAAAGCPFVGIDTDGRAEFAAGCPVVPTVAEAVRAALAR
ncbi:MAG: HAD family hydrolase [Dermatophilaceae bacterium]